MAFSIWQMLITIGTYISTKLLLWNYHLIYLIFAALALWPILHRLQCLADAPGTPMPELKLEKMLLLSVQQSHRTVFNADWKLVPLYNFKNVLISCSLPAYDCFHCILTVYIVQIRVVPSWLIIYLRLLHRLTFFSWRLILTLTTDPNISLFPIGDMAFLPNWTSHPQ